MFRAEFMMYEPLVAYFRAQGLLVLREVTTSEGRADIVAARIDWEAARKRMKLGFRWGLARLPLLRAWEALPPDKTISVDTWAEALEISRCSTRALARELEQSRFITRSADGYTRRGCVPRVITHLVCCEAKLDNWKRGLDQAYGHRFYTNQSYLALANRVPRSTDLQLMESRQVGLLSVTDHVVEVLPSAERRPGSTLTRDLIEERFWLELVAPQLGPRKAPVMREAHDAIA